MFAVRGVHRTMRWHIVDVKGGFRRHSDAQKWARKNATQIAQSGVSRVFVGQVRA